MGRIRMNTAEILLTIVTVCTIQGVRAGLAGFGGDYGEYLELLKGNDVLDDIEEGQARQEAVMGGEEEESKGGFLRHLKLKKKKKKTDVHFHFDVNVLVVNRNMTESSKLFIEKVRPNLEKEIKFIERDSNGGSLTSSSKTEPFDWKAMQTGGSKPWESKPTGQTGGGASGGWGGKTGGGQAGGVPSPEGAHSSSGSPTEASTEGQSGNLGQRSFELGRESRGIGGNWMRKESNPLPLQMVVILNPKAELFDEVTDKLENANKKVDNNLIYDVISKIKKSKQKTIDYNERSADETESEYTRVVPEEDPNEVNEKIKEKLTEFTSTYDDPMVITSRLPKPYHSLIISGLSTITICSMTSTGHTWKVYLCPDSLTATVSITSGPNMPFNGKVTATYTKPQIRLMFTKSKDLIRLTNTQLASKSTKFQPDFDSTVPLNPWSKVSLGGYMVAKAKKVLNKLVENKISVAFKGLI